MPLGILVFPPEAFLLLRVLPSMGAGCVRRPVRSHRRMGPPLFEVLALPLHQTSTETARTAWWFLEFLTRVGGTCHACRARILIIYLLGAEHEAIEHAHFVLPSQAEP